MSTSTMVGSSCFFVLLPQNRSVELPTHFDDYDVDGDPDHRDVLDAVLEMVNRRKVSAIPAARAPPPKKAFENYSGNVIPYEELKIQEKIGHGSFGDVHSALWNGKTQLSCPYQPFGRGLTQGLFLSTFPDTSDGQKSGFFS